MSIWKKKVPWSEKERDAVPIESKQVEAKRKRYGAVTGQESQWEGKDNHSAG